MTERRNDLALFDEPLKLAAKRVSPKRPRVEQAGIADVFPYYAGFSYDWALNELRAAADVPGCVALDPWNGSGTTTLAAAQLGIPAVGVDLHPVANLVAKARNIGGASRLEQLPAPSPDARTNASLRPLGAWFAEGSAKRISQWAADAERFDPPTSLVAMLAMFRSVRSLTKGFEGSNPTWVRRARADHELVVVDPVEIDEAISESFSWVRKRFADRQETLRRKPNIVLASAGRLPIRSASIQRVVTSPPYLTRIDYGVAYARELAVMGLDVGKYRNLRSALMGTTLIRRTPSPPEQRHNPVALELVKAMTGHSSKDSSGYYRKQLAQYLSDLTDSVRELARVAAAGAQMTVVVQDSYYKDIEVRLSDILLEEAHHWGWATTSVEKFVVDRLLTTLNTPARVYQKGEVAESVIRLERLDSAREA